MWTHRANFGCSTTLPTDQRTVDEYSAPVFGKGLREYKSITFRPDTYSFREIDSEIVKLQTELISETDFQKLRNKNDNNYVNGNASIEGIAGNLASFYLLYGDVNLINTEIEMYRSITRDEIRTVAKKYLNPNQRLILNYIPKAAQAKN